VEFWADRVLSLNPVAFWRLNDASAPFFDSGPNGLHSSGYAFAHGYRQTAYALVEHQDLLGPLLWGGGSSSSAQFTASSLYDFEWDQAFAAFAWFYPIGNAGPLVCKANGAGTLGWEFGLDTGRPFFAMYQSGAVYIKVMATDSVSFTAMNGIAFTYDGSGTPEGVALYLNGRLLASTATGVASFSSGSIKAPDRVTIAYRGTVVGGGSALYGRQGDTVVFGPGYPSTLAVDIFGFAADVVARYAAEDAGYVRSVSRPAKNLRSLTSSTSTRRRKRRKVNPGVN